MKALIIGASGFLGSSITQAALSQGWKVWGIYYKNKDLVPNGCEKISIDELNRLKDNFDLIYIAIGNFALSRKDLIYTNIDIPTQVSRKFKSSKIIFSSSVNVYGLHKDIIITTASFNNPSYYGLSKLAGEFIVSGHEKFTIIRFTNLYGVGMAEKSFIPTIIKDATSKKLITLTSNGERMHDYLYVEDAANLCIKAGIRGRNEIYLGVTGNSISNLEIAKIIQKFIPNCKITFSGADNAQSFLFNVKATRKNLAWSPRKKIEVGLKELIDHYEGISI